MAEFSAEDATFPHDGAVTPVDDGWPHHGLAEDIRPAWRALAGAGVTVATATLVDCAGSSPRPVGSQLLATRDGIVAGHINSATCIESNLAVMMAEAIDRGRGDMVIFGEGSPYFDIRLLCGGSVVIAIDVIRPDDPAARDLLAHDAARRPALWTGDLATGSHQCREIAGDLPRRAAERDGDRYVKLYRPAPRLIVNGGDPVALALAFLGAASGFDMVLNHGRGPERPPRGFTGQYLRLAEADLLKALPPDPWTAVVSTTHDIECDHAVLKDALPSAAFYVGCLGSRRHIPARRELLAEAGVPRPAIDRLVTPVGLAIGAATPAEIAISVLADVVRVWRGA